jgi:hypothetical protein
MVRLARSIRRLHLAFFLILGLTLQFAIPASVLAAGPPQFVQQKSFTTVTTFGVSSISTTFSSSVAAGHTIVVALSGFGSTSVILPTFVSDSANDHFVKAFDFPLFAASDTSSIGIWYASNVAGGAAVTVTGSFSGFGTLAIAIQEYSGIGPAVSAYQAVGASGNNVTALTCLPVQVSQSGELLVAATTIDNHVNITSATAGTGFTVRTQQLVSDTTHQALVTEDEGTGATLAPGNYQPSMQIPLVSGTSPPAWHLVAVGFGTTVSPTNTPLPTPVGSPVPDCVTAATTAVFLPAVMNGALAGW